MTRNLEVLGLALVAVFALSAVTASAAFGAEEFFHSHKESTIYTGESTSEQKFELFSGFAVVCKKSKLAGTETGIKHEGGAFGTTWTTTSVTVTPTYEECTLDGHPATVDTKTNECHFALIAETTETTAGKPMGNIEVKCKEGGTINIKVEALGIEIHVANQTLLHGISYTNNKPANTEEWDITVNATVGTEGPSKINWTCTPKVACMSGLGAHEGTEATYTGGTLLKGFSDTEKTATGTYKESTQTGIWRGPEGEPEYFHSHRQHTILTGEQVSGSEQTITLFNKSSEPVPIECAGGKLAGTETGEELGHEATFTTSSITIHPEYYGAGGSGTKCTFAALELGVAVNTGTCHYLMGAETVKEHGELKIECGEGAIELSLPNCVIKLPTQTPSGGGLNYEDNKTGGAEEWDFKVKSTAEGVKYTTNNGIGCKALGLPTEATNGKISGEMTVKGYGDKEKTETGVYKEGAQTAVWHGLSE